MVTATKTDQQNVRSEREHRTGVVLSDNADKTIRVRFDFMVKHPKYGKFYKRSTTLHSHDEKNEASAGDLVEVMACRRLSKTKFWTLSKILRKAAE